MKSRLHILQELTSLTTVPVNLVVAAQSQALAVRAVQNHIYWMSVPLNYRVCSSTWICGPFASGCASLAATMYKQRHDRIAKIIYWNLLKCFDQSVSHNYRNYVLSKVMESSEVKDMWNSWDLNINYINTYLSNSNCM